MISVRSIEKMNIILGDYGGKEVKKQCETFQMKAYHDYSNEKIENFFFPQKNFFIYSWGKKPFLIYADF